MPVPPCLPPRTVWRTWCSWRNLAELPYSLGTEPAHVCARAGEGSACACRPTKVRLVMLVGSCSCLLCCEAVFSARFSLACHTGNGRVPLRAKLRSPTAACRFGGWRQTVNNLDASGCLWNSWCAVLAFVDNADWLAAQRRREVMCVTVRALPLLLHALPLWQCAAPAPRVTTDHLCGMSRGMSLVPAGATWHMPMNSVTRSVVIDCPRH